MSKPTCAHADCSKPVQARGLCNTHYWHAWKDGQFPKMEPRGVCSEEDCSNPVHSSATGLCNTHHKRMQRHGHTGLAGPVIRRVRQDNIGYNSAHLRVRLDRGRAGDLACVDCGSPAQHWSYDHKDEAEMMDDRGRPYSAKTEHYEPRCVACHRAFDKRRKHLVTPTRKRTQESA